MNALVSPSVDARHAPRAQLWTGRALTGVITLFLLLDGAAKLIPLAPVIEATQKLGYSTDVIRPLGVVLCASTLLHLARRTQLVGAVLLTAYLGGATATHVHSGTPFVFPIVMGVLLWIAYALRSAELRSLVFSSSR